MSLDLPALVQIVRRWWWLVLLAPLAGGSAMYFYGKAQQPMYRATALLWVQMAPGAEGPDPSVIQGNINLAEMYRYLVTVEPVLAPVIDNLRLPYSIEELRDHMTVNVVRSTPLLEIAASDADPDRAAAIATGVAGQFGKMINQLGALDPASNATDAGNPIEPNLAVRMVPSEVPLEPYAPRVTLFALLGAAVGLVFATGVAGLNEYLRLHRQTSANLAPIQDAPRAGPNRTSYVQSGRG